MRRALDGFVRVAMVALAYIGLLRLGSVDIPLATQLISGVLSGLVVEAIVTFGPRRRRES